MTPILSIANVADHRVGDAELTRQRDDFLSLCSSSSNFHDLFCGELGAWILFALHDFRVLTNKAVIAALHFFGMLARPMVIAARAAFQSAAQPSLLLATVFTSRFQAYGILFDFGLMALIVFADLLGGMGASGGLTAAYSTMAVAFGITISVRLVVGMTLRAMRFFQIGVVRSMIGSLAILFVCDGAQVFGIHAGPVSTDVVQFQPFMDFSNKVEIGCPISQARCSVLTEDPVAVGISRSSPFPASFRGAAKFGVEAFQGFWFHTVIIPRTSAIVNRLGLLG